MLSATCISYGGDLLFDGARNPKSLHTGVKGLTPSHMDMPTYSPCIFTYVHPHTLTCTHAHPPIQCEQCLCWQHGDCIDITKETLPEKYICYICTNPPGEIFMFCVVNVQYNANTTSSSKPTRPPVTLAMSVGV